MVNQQRVLFYPTLPGVLASIAPLLLLHPAVEGSSVPGILIGLGIPALVFFSLLYLLITFPFIRRWSKKIDHNLLSLPGVCNAGENITVEADPKRPVFLPGTRLFLHWRFSFGPFKEKLFIPLPPRGKGRGQLKFSRRGHWLGRPYFHAADPFGFFVFRCAIDVQRNITVPPKPVALTRGFPAGKKSTVSAAAPRLKDDAEERLERRQYNPGDDTRRLDWKHYARTGEFMIRIGEDAIQTRGKTWLQVAASRSRFVKKRYGQLDSSLSMTMALVHLLTEAGEVLTRFPGEEKWINTNHKNWLECISRVEPGSLHTRNTPSAGESLFIVSSSKDMEGYQFYTQARQAGCQSVFITSDSNSVRRPWWWFFEE